MMEKDIPTIQKKAGIYIHQYEMKWTLRQGALLKDRDIL